MAFNADTLASTLHLMKNRNCDFIRTSENYKFIEETNSLLKNALVLNLVKSIEDDVNEYYRRSTSQSSAQSSETEVNLQNLRKKGEILFFTFYQTQITDEEEKALVKLIKLLSNLIVVPSNQSQSGILTPSWQIPICSLLVIIQLTHVCALQQSTTLLSRERDYSHVRTISELEMGNSLPSNKAGQKYDVSGGDFKCEGVRGFACLAYAALRQPVVDVDAAPALDVEYFLYNACISRAYSYIRLVMLPVLQTSYVQDRDTSIFYVQVLCELLASLSRTFCSAHYRDQYGCEGEDSRSAEQERLGEHDFPFAFFPPSQSFYAANKDFYLENEFHPKTAAAAGKGATSSTSSSSSTSSKDGKEAVSLAVDSLEDVLLLLNALLAVRPEFATEFWSEASVGMESSFDLSFCGGEGGKKELAPHPFVSKTLEASRQHPSLLLVTIQFCAHLAGGPLGTTADGVYRLVKDARHPLLSWTHFFSVVDKIVQHLGATLSGGATLTSSGGAAVGGALSTAGTGLFGTMRGGGATYAETIRAQQQMHLHQHSRHHRPLQLTSKDLDGLLGILELLAAVCVSGSVAQHVLEQYPLVSRMFSLLSCASLPALLKGAALRLLAVLARLSASHAAAIWEAIDFHKLLPSSSSATGGLSGGASSSSASLLAHQSVANSGGLYNMNATMNLGGMGAALSGQQGGGPFAHIAPTVAGGPFNSNAPHGSHPHERGLRAELEESEARNGQYPVTDGFLSLLQALLLHGVPNAVSVGEGHGGGVSAGAFSSGPQHSLMGGVSPSSSFSSGGGGVVRYLEYVVQDVLLKAHERLYSPADSPLAYGERFRVTAKALRVLTLVLQHYRINLLPDDILVRLQPADGEGGEGGLSDEDKAVLTAKGLWDALQDFCEGTLTESRGALIETGGLVFGVNTNTDRASPGAASVRPKTAAFHLMVQLLNKSRLFELLTNLMTECHADALLHAYNTQCLFEIGRSVSIVQQLHSHSLNSHTYNLANHSMVAVAPPSLTDMRNSCSLSSRNSNDCDSIFWREKAVSGAVGLLYEVSLREKKFHALLRSTDKQLTIAHTEQGRTSVLSVAVEDFSMHLCSSAALSLVTHFLAHTGMTAPCVPSVPVMCVRLLEHVALNIPSYQLLASLSQPLSLQHLGAANRQLSLCDRMIESVVRALHVSNTSADIPHSASLCYDVVPLGGDPTPDTFSLSLESTYLGPVNLLSSSSSSSSSPASVRASDAPLSDTALGMSLSPVTEGGVASRSLQAVHKEYLRAANKHGSIRECVLRLLLSTLTPTSICLSHFLLGLTPSQQQQQQQQGIGGVQSRSATACFEAVLDLLSPESYPLGATLLQLYPSQATDCYELLYRLVASPAVRSMVVARLNSPHVNYLQVHGTLLLYMTHLSDEELLFRRGAEGTASAKRRVETVKSALHQSLAWLLKTTSVVLYTVSSAVATNSAHTMGATSGGLRKVMATLLSLYYNSCTELAFSGERAAEQSALSKVLDHCTLFPAAPLNSQSMSPAVRDCIAAASRRLQLSKAGSGFGAHNRFRQQDAGTLELLSQSLQYVDITLLQQYLQERREALEEQMAVLATRGGRIHRSAGAAPPLSLSREQCSEGVHAAVMSNLYSQRVGAMVHCCMAWTQLVQISTVLPQPQLVRATITVAVLDGLFDVSYVFAQLLVPLLNVLLARPLVDVLVAETLARGMLGLLSYVLAESNCANNEAALGVEEFHFLLEGLLRLLIARRVGGAEGSVDNGPHRSSLLFRSLVSTALTATLHSLTAAASAVRVVSTEKESPSEEIKGSSSPFDQSGAAEGRRVSVLDVTVLEDYQQLTVALLETHVTSLVDTLATDVVLAASSPLTRCTLLGALSAVVSLLAPTAFSVGGSDLGGERSTHEAYGSHAFLQAVQLLVNRRHLNGILASIGGEEGSLNEGLLASSLTLCTHLATTREGVEGLVVCGLMERLVSMTDFLEPPALRSELLSFGVEALRTREEDVQAMHSKLVPVLRLLTTLLVTFPTHKTVHTGATNFLRRNHKIVSQLLRLRYLTLTGLNMTELLVGIFSVLLSRKVLVEQSLLQLLSTVPSSSGGGHSSFSAPAASDGDEGVLGGGDLANSFIADLCSLLGAIGSDILPSHFAIDRCPSKDANHSTWWSHIHPETTRPSELVAARTLFVASDLAASLGTESLDPTVPMDWTLFDHFKLSLGLSLAVHLATCLRSLSTNAVSSGRKSMQPVVVGSAISSPELMLHLEMDLLSAVFVKAADRILMFQSGGETSETPSISENDIGSFDHSHLVSGDWLSSPLPVVSSIHSRRTGNVFHAISDSGNTYVARHLLPRLVFVTENLICVIHDMVLLANPGQFEFRFSALIIGILNTVEQFPSHSFLRQTARWISESFQ